MSDKTGKKTGSVKWTDYENEEYYKSLEPLLQQLNDDLPNARYDRKSLARMFGELQQFMEDALGKQALPPRPFPKLPQKLLRNFSADGPLNIVATVCYRVKTESNWKRVEFNNPARKRENVELLRQIRKELQRQRYLTLPVVFIHPSCGNDMNTLKEIVQRLGGEVAASPSDTHVTHIVYPFGPAGDPDDGLEYMRTLAFRTHEALVHWWYLPDSYDEYIPRSVAPDKLEPDRQPLGPWKVYLRWVLDSAKFNEWMNPCDYETAEFQEEQDKLQAKKKLAAGGGAASTQADRGRTPPLTSAAEDDYEDPEKEEAEEGAEPEGAIPLKRKRAEESEVVTERDAPGDESASKARRVEVDPGGGERIGPNAVRQRLLQPHAPAMDGSVLTENLSQGQQPVTIVPGLDRPVLPPKPLPPPPPIVKKEVYPVPAHSAWFRWNKIHDIERRHVPDFFNTKSASKTPQLYVEYRNFMITKYREHPFKRLTFTECRKYLLGDVTGIMRVWQFLDSWGLINYMARDGPKQVVHLEAQPGEGAAVRVVTAPEAPSSNLLFNFSMPVVEPTVAATYGASNLSLVTRRDVFGQHRCAWESAAEKTEFYCNAMPHVNCTELRYHCTKYPDIDLCPQAFAEGRFPVGCSSKDFVRIDRRAEQPDESGWTPQETLLLLEALEMYGDNWSEVADHVGSKSQVQCIMQFLQLPIEDQFLDELDEAGKNIGRPTAKAVQEVEEEQEEDLIPFADMSNPIMAQVAFLAMAVGPRVAAAAAKKALEVLSQEEPAVLREVQEETLALESAKPPQQAARGREGDTGEKDEGGTPKEVAGDAKGGDRDTEAQAMDTSPAKAEDPASPKKATGQKEGTQGSTGGTTIIEDEAEGEGVPLDTPLSSAKVRVAAATALAAAAVKAKLLADNEEREIQRLVVQVVDQQMKKLDIKLKSLNELEQALEQERAALATARRQADSERVQLQGLRTHMTQTHASLSAQGMPQSAPGAVGPGVNPFGQSLYPSGAAGIPGGNLQGSEAGPTSVTPGPAMNTQGMGTQGMSQGMGMSTQMGPASLMTSQAGGFNAPAGHPSTSIPGFSNPLNLPSLNPQGQGAQQTPQMHTQPSAYQSSSQHTVPSALPQHSTSQQGLSQAMPARLPTPASLAPTATPPSSIPTGYAPSSFTSLSQPMLRQPGMLAMSAAMLSTPPASSVPFATSSNPMPAQPGGLSQVRPVSMPLSSSYLGSSPAPSLRQPSQPSPGPIPYSHSSSAPPPQPSLPASTPQDQAGYSHTHSHPSRLPAPGERGLPTSAPTPTSMPVLGGQTLGSSGMALGFGPPGTQLGGGEV